MATTSAGRLDALIVGAGPVGLTMATELIRHGLRCRIIDKAAQATDKSKAMVIWARTLELLEKAGLAERFVNIGYQVSGASIYAEGERKVHLSVQVAHTHYPRPLMVPQCTTEKLLAEHLHSQGMTVERSVELISLAEQNNEVTSVLRHPDGHEEVVKSSWLLGCDGAHSTVRHQLGMEFEGNAEPNDWILADVHVEGPISPDEISVFWHTSGVLIFFPFETHRYRIVADQGLARGVARPADPTLEQAQAVVNERGPAGLRLYEPIWLAGFRINERKVAQYSRGRVFLSGDAAHIHSPAGGQGMNTGMQDAVNLAWKLALAQKGRGRISPLLDSYSQERSEVGEQVLANAGALTRVATLRNPIGQFVRNHTASLLSSLSVVQHKASSTLTELAIHYPHSPLNGQHRGLRVLGWLTGGLKPGERLPDADIVLPPGPEKRRLLAELGGTSHHLLLLAGSGEPTAISALAAIAAQVRSAYGDLISTTLLVEGALLPSAAVTHGPAIDHVYLDLEGTVHAQHAAREATLVLVRPDGYINFRSQPAEADSLLKHLATYLM